MALRGVSQPNLRHQAAFPRLKRQWEALPRARAPWNRAIWSPVTPAKGVGTTGQVMVGGGEGSRVSLAVGLGCGGTLLPAGPAFPAPPHGARPGGESVRGECGLLISSPVAVRGGTAIWAVTLK